MDKMTTWYSCTPQSGDACNDTGVVKNDLKEDSAEHILLCEMLQTRLAAGLTQAKLADKMGTKASAVARMELALSGKKQYATPTLATLKKYAQAVDCKLVIHLVPIK